MGQTLEKCPECGAFTESVEGPTHAYMKSSPGRWKVFGSLLAREYSNPDYMRVHRLTVDTYACQHGGDDPRAIQSVNVHLVALCLFHERKLSFASIPHFMEKIISAHKGNFSQLPLPNLDGVMKVTDVIAAQTSEEHCRLVTKWSAQVWDAWGSQHRKIFALLA